MPWNYNHFYTQSPHFQGGQINIIINMMFIFLYFVEFFVGSDSVTRGLIAEYSTLFSFKSSWVAFAVCFGSLFICTIKRRSISFAAFDWIWTESISLYFRIDLIITKQPRAAEAMQLYVSQIDAVCFDHELFQAFFRLFSSRHSGTGWSYFQLSKECFSRSLLRVVKPLCLLW